MKNKLLSFITALAVFFLPYQPVHATDLTTNLVSYWDLDETSGTRVDSTASGYDLTDNNTVTYTTGIIGNAATFTAANTEYLSITDAAAPNLDITGDLSVSYWINMTSQPSAGAAMCVVSKYGLSNQKSWLNNYYNSGGTPNVYQIGFYTSADGSTENFPFLTQTLSNGTWYHVVSVYDSTAGQIEIFVNGSSIGTAAEKTSLFNSSQGFKLGVMTDSVGGLDQKLNGSLDEFGIWSRKLTSPEVTSLYNSGSGLAYPFSSPSIPVYNDAIIFE